MKKPKIRKLVPSNGPGESGKGYVVSDPLGLSPAAIPVTEAELAAMRLMNGLRSAAEIAGELRSRGVRMAPSAVAKLEGRLSANLMIECAKSRKAAEDACARYRSGHVRLMKHKGECYPAGAAEFDAELAKRLRRLPPSKACGAAGAFAPHIDISIAWPAYAAAYAPIAAERGASTAIILGTAHFRDVNRFMLTEKPFETPFGRMEVDLDFTSRLRKAFGGDLFKDELIHAHEHSVEFQAVFLHAMLARAGRSMRIVPLLVSSFAPFIERGSRPSEDPLVNDFVSALAEAASHSGGGSLIVAGVDLAHVGRKFGDDWSPDRTTLRDLKKADGRTLAHAAACDAEGFWDDIASDGNARRICGVAPMYVALRLLKGCSGAVVSYGRDFQPETGFAVTYAGMVFTRGA